MNNRNANIKKIINVLITQLEPVSVKQISNLTQIPERTVRYITDCLFIEYGLNIQASKKGFYIGFEERKNVSSFFKNLDEDPQFQYDNRKTYILSQLLTLRRPLKMEKVLDEFFITKGTLSNDITNIKKDLESYDISFYTKGNYILLEGSLVEKKRIMLDILEQELDESSFSLEAIQGYFSDVNLLSIKSITTDALKEVGLELDNYSLINYIIHLAVLVFFGNTHSFFDDASLDFEPELSKHINKLVNSIYEKLKITFPDSVFFKKDLFDTSMLMITRLTPADLSNSTIDIQKTLGKEVLDILDEIITSTYNNYAISLYSENFTIRFGLHIKNLLERSRNSLEIKNQVFASIRDKFPLLFSIAAHIAGIINKHLDNRLSEDEISFIALYIGIIIDESKKKSNILNCLLIASNHSALQSSLLNLINREFSEQLNIVSVATVGQINYDTENINLIISTIDTFEVSSVPTVFINPLPTEKDILNIRKYIENTNRLKAIEIVRNQILDFFKEDLFFSSTNLKTREETINFICNEMNHRGYVTQNFVNDIFEHENICPTSYGNAVISHPLSGSSEKSAISVLIQTEPIPWGDNNVNVVFIFTLNKNAIPHFTDVFNLITKLVSDQNKNEILKVKTFQDFINLIISAA